MAMEKLQQGTLQRAPTKHIDYQNAIRINVRIISPF